MELIANWFWQGCAVAVATGIALRAMKSAAARTRYVVCWAALLAVFALPLPALVPTDAASPALDPGSAAPAPSGLVLLPVAWWTSNSIVLLMLALWSAVQVLRLSFAASALQRARQRCRPFPHRLETRLFHWTCAKQGGRRARLMLSEHIGAAAVLGGWRPVIAVAPALIDRLSDDEIDGVVIHEWAHVQRRDDVANAMQVIARVIAGWHPAVWWLDRRLKAEREAACDEMAVAVTGSTKAYAACLVKLAGLPRAAGPVPALGMSSPSLTARVENVLSRKPGLFSKRPTSAAAAAIVVVVAASIAAGSLDLVDTATLQVAREQPVQAAASASSTATASTQPLVKTPAGRRATVRRAARPPDVIATLADAPDVPSSTATDVEPAPQLATIPRQERASVSFETPIYRPDASVSEPSPAAHPPQASSAPWDAAADAGVAVGRGSKKAGLATAGFFTRMGKGIAGSFSSATDARSSR